MLQKSKKTKSSRRKREKFRKSLLSNSRFPQKRTSKTPFAWYNDFILLDHPYNPTGTQSRSGSTRRQHLHEDLEKSTCCPRINITNKKFSGPPPNMWTNFENFGAIDLQNPNEEPAGSWSTRRKQLREISKNPPVAHV